MLVCSFAFVVAELIYTVSLRPVTEQQANALAVVRSPDALGDGGADVYGHQFGTAFLVVVLGYRVRDLRGIASTLRKEDHEDRTHY